LKADFNDELEANFNGLDAYLGTVLDFVYNSAPLLIPMVDFPPIKLDGNILINNNNILNTVILDLIPNTGELELLMREVKYK
jgi:hypothetical protein